jgi:hypothetical protein
VGNIALVAQRHARARVSTRSVDDLVKGMGKGGISKSQVSRLCAEIEALGLESTSLLALLVVKPRLAWAAVPLANRAPFPVRSSS